MNQMPVVTPLGKRERECVRERERVREERDIYINVKWVRRKCVEKSE